jgi:hypothetical protein
LSIDLPAPTMEPVSDTSISHQETNDSHEDDDSSKTNIDSHSGRCHICIGLLFWLVTFEFGNLRDSAWNGCAECHLLLCAILSYVPLSEEEDQWTVFRHRSSIKLQSTSDKKNQMSITLYGDGSEGYFKLGAFSPLPLERIPEVSGVMFSPQLEQQALEWINTCISEHDTCGGAVDEILPTRILKIDPDDYKNVCLYETDNEMARYLCLSHCWGGSDVIRTLKDNRKHFWGGIEWTTLPKTFQDAIFFTHSLGMEFLWIDSLCIIQDDDDDWRAEGGKMSNVYEKATLVLAATKNSGPHDGLFASTPGLKLMELIVEGWPTVYMRQTIPHLTDPKYFPLLRRAWVFQERLLSQRMLHFGQHELLWECAEGEKCECTFTNDPGLSEPWYHGKRVYDTLLAENQSQSWWKTVEQYSQLNLTFEKDIFPALSGIAHLHQKVNQCDFFAGLWSDTFLIDLLWHTTFNSNIIGRTEKDCLALRPKEWRAPSWSWASITTPVVYTSIQKHKSSITEFNITFRPMSGDSYGQLHEPCILHLEAPIGVVTIHRVTENPATHQQVADDSLGAATLYKDQRKVEDVEFYLDYDVWGESQHQLQEGQTMYCLEVGSICVAEEKDKTDMRVCFLILHMVQGEDIEEEGGKYVRVGLVMSKQEATDLPTTTLALLRASQALTKLRIF